MATEIEREMLKRVERDERLEVIQDELERLLRKCELQELIPVAQVIEIETDEKSKRQLLREMQEIMDASDAATRLDLFATLLPALPEKMRPQLQEILTDATVGAVPAAEEETTVDSVEKGEIDGAAMPLLVREKPKDLTQLHSADTDEGGTETTLNQQIRELRTQLMQIKSSEAKPSSSIVGDTATGLGQLTTATRLFQRDFKIVGTVGAVNSKEALNYISLCSQIAEGKRKRYPDEEIAMGVRKAVCAGTPMRTYLDSSTDMTLTEVVSFVRNCLGEKSASELFQSLTNLVQTGEEDAQMFVLRALELREKVARSSAMEGSVRFDSGVVQDAFKHTVKTGLRSDQMRMRLEPALSGPMKDDELLRLLNLAMSEEAERVAKQKKIVKVHTATASTADTSATDTLQKTVSELVNQMKAMQEEMEASRNEATFRRKSDGRRQDQSQADPPQAGGRVGGQEQVGGQGHFARGQAARRQATSWKKQGCQQCLDSGKASCYHCWKCGANGHIARQCQQNPLNRNALPVKGGSQ